MQNFNQQTKIAIVGVSFNKEKYGYKIFKDLLKAHYNVVGINPKGGTLLKQKIYQSLEDLPYKIELLILVVPASTGIEVIKTAHKLGVENFWLQPGAESETIIEYARENNLNLNYNTCFMVDQGIW